MVYATFCEYSFHIIIFYYYIPILRLSHCQCLLSLGYVTCWVNFTLTATPLSFSSLVFPTAMSSSVRINAADPTAPTPQNTPLVTAPISGGLSRPTIPETVSEEIDDLDEHGDLDDPVAALSVEAKRSLTALLGVQAKQTELQKEFKREVWELEKKASAYTFDPLCNLPRISPDTLSQRSISNELSRFTKEETRLLLVPLLPRLRKSPLERHTP